MNPSILIVDDSKTSRMVSYAFLFTLFGPDVACLEAETGDQALALLASTPVDIVLLDLTMPGGLSGFDVLAEMQRRAMTTPVVVVSADGQRRTRERVAALGAAGFIEKPLRLESLVDTMTTLGVGCVE
ncbi:MAG: response regulator [Pseudomonadota bacterium]